MKKYGFTLAEVLITLGIIGVIAALIMSTIIQEYKKINICTKLKKASSSLMQATNLAGTDEYDTREYFTPDDPNEALRMFNKYYVPYIKFRRVEKGSKGVFAYMTDGTVLYFRKTNPDPGWSCTYIIVCINQKACKNINENNPGHYGAKLVNGKNTFTLYTNGKVPGYTFKHQTRQQRINDCKNNNSIEACTALIFEAGWKIPNDYPIKL